MSVRAKNGEGVSYSHQVESLEDRRLLASVTFAEFDGPTPVYTPKAHLVVRFDRSVAATFGPADVKIRNLDDGTEIINDGFFGDNFAVSYHAATNTGVITFPGLIGEQLVVDGNYRLILNAAGIVDSSNVPLDGNGDGTPGDDYTFDFYRFTGDTQVDMAGAPRRDRYVDFTDYQVMAKNFGKTNAIPQDGDFNYDGAVNSVDFDILYGVPFDPFYPGTFGTRLPPPPSAPAPVVVSAPAPAPEPAPVTAKKPVAKAKPAAAKPAAAKPAVSVTVAPSRFAVKKIKGSADLLA